MKRSEILSIAENEYAVPEGADYRSIASELEVHLGSPDLLTRDKSFEILSAWSEKGIFTDTELVELGNRMATNLSVGLGESDTDSVFLRAFSALVLADVIYTDTFFSKGKCDGRSSFLSADLLNKWLKQATESFIGEQDLRGYIEGKNWAHSIAHFGDLFRQFPLNPHSTKIGHLLILDVFAKKLTQPAKIIFNGFEDGRLGRVVTAIWMRNMISLEDFEKWLQQIVTPFIGAIWYDEKPDPSTFNVRLNARVNSRMFLQILYFMLLFGDKRLYSMDESYYKNLQQYRNSLVELVAQAIKKLDNNDFYYQEKIDKM